MQISMTKIANLIIIIDAILLPIQACLIFLFKLPVWAQFLYPILIISFIFCLFIPYKYIMKSIDKTFVILFSGYLLALLISLVLNYEQISEYGIKFIYYITKYSMFWDRPDMRMFNWGILRPFLFMMFACSLFIFMSFKNSIRKFLKTIIIVGLISSLYSCYQIVAAQFGLPFASIFSGHNGEVIYLFGNIRRVEGIFFEAGPQAIFLAPVFLILFLQLFENKEKSLFKKRTTILFLIPIFITMFFTFSPIAYLTFLLGIPICIGLNYKTISQVVSIKKIIKAVSITAAIICISALIYMWTTENYNTDFSIQEYMIRKIAVSTTEINDFHPDNRAIRNMIGVQIFKEFPIFGCGPAGAIIHYGRIGHFTWNAKMLDQTAILNTHLKILCETGIFGFVFYFLIITYPIYLYIKKFKTPKYNKYIIDSLFTAYLFHIVFAASVNPQFLMSYTWLLYVPLVILLKRKECKIV